MRDIKFRALPLDSNEWVKGNYAKTIVGNYESEKHQILPFGENVLSKYIDVSTLGQYIGIKDKNGIEIYEHDIVEISGGEKHQGHTELDERGIIKYSLTNSFDVVNMNNIHLSFGYCPIEEIRVIGNIFENPELMQ